MQGTFNELISLNGASALETTEFMAAWIDKSGTPKAYNHYVDGAKAGEGRIDATQPMVFSGDETTDVGSDGGTPVSDDYGPKDSRFSGRVRWVQIDLDVDDHDHLISPEERLRVAMARQ